MSESFTTLFSKLTGGLEPFPWQADLYSRFERGEVPSQVDIQTGLGKTSVVTVWLSSLINRPDKVPRRLVYVVNRRTVVDQTTEEVKGLRERLAKLNDYDAALKRLCAIPTDVPLAISTLRGQFADNREWCVDPTRPAVIIGTVDMIGSGLLFNRYTCGFKTRPHHAGLLGQDVLLVHDEAHLEPAFQALLDSIEAEQRRCNDLRPLKILHLSATNRNPQGDRPSSPPLRLSPADEANQTIRRRILAVKKLRLTAITEEKQLAEKLGELALARKDSGRAVLIFARTIDTIQKLRVQLSKAGIRPAILTGTMRGAERDVLTQKPIFRRFLPKSEPPTASESVSEGTAYLLATSAGEVGINLSAGELICDLSTFENMAQRFGRVNRFGLLADSTVDVVHPEKFETDPSPLDQARQRTLELLRKLDGDASPKALDQLSQQERSAAFSPPVQILPATDILFDAWAMTTIRDIFPGRPPVACYLHGKTDWTPPETSVAWRDEVEIINDSLAKLYPPEDLLTDYALKPHELLRDRSDRVLQELVVMAKRHSAARVPVWLIAAEGTVRRLLLSDLIAKDSEESIDDCTLLLPPFIGGLSSEGLLDGNEPASAEKSLDVSNWGPEENPQRRRVFSNDPKSVKNLSGLRVVKVIDTLRDEEELEEFSEEQLRRRFWLWLEAPMTSDADSLRSIGKAVVLLEEHSQAVEAHAKAITGKLNLPATLANCVVLAARFHDIGKRRSYWQRGIGNLTPDYWLAKAGPGLISRRLSEPYRHDFGSLLDAAEEEEMRSLPQDEQDLILHLIAAHHGRGRPHFPAEESFDPSPSRAGAPQRAAAETPLRFARLQRKYGRWGLAYLESLLRAADYAASAEVTS